MMSAVGCCGMSLLGRATPSPTAGFTRVIRAVLSRVELL